ncbi:MAG: membrane protein [Bacteroidetes bacterium OLB11]|nr:MAG: membrane protein [Bacteroidetes bacterium OLB11]
MFNQDSIMQIINNVAYQKSKELTEKQLNRDKEYWERIRHDTLSKNEQAIYTMIDTIQSLPIYKKYTRLIYTLTTGIINTGPIKIGSFYSFL